MKVRLPKEWDSDTVGKILTSLLSELEKKAADKKLKSLTTLGSDPASNLDDLDVGLYVDPADNSHKLNIRSQGRNWAVSLTEET